MRFIYKIDKFFSNLSMFWYEHVECRLKPKQKWLSNIIPHTFTDIDTLIEDITFECLIHYWENDDGEKTLRAQYTMFDDPNDTDLKLMYPDLETFAKQRAENFALYEAITEAYNWAKHRKAYRDTLVSTLSHSYGFSHWRETAAWYAEEEVKFIEKDTKYLNVIIQYRQYLWS